MKKPFNSNTRMSGGDFKATEYDDSFWFVVVHPDDSKAAIDLDKETAIKLAEWILKED